MAAGLPDLVDCQQLADAGAVLVREYPVRDLTRLENLLAVDDGVVHAAFAFSKLGSGRSAASVTVDASPRMICQRCSQPFQLPVRSSGEVVFVANEDDEADADREPYLMKSGLVSLRDMAEEEVLMALPAAAACSSPETCGNMPPEIGGVKPAEPAIETRRPFAGLKELLKKS